MPRVVIVRNPASRRALDRAALEAACAVLGDRWDVEVVDSTLSLGVAAVARNAAFAGVEYVLACGGDGTLNEVVNGVVSAQRPDVVVGLIPAGTANVWAQEARIPREPMAAVRLLEDGRAVALDLGHVRTSGVDRYFLLMCSLGLDAAIVAEVERRGPLKRRLAQGAYVVAGSGVLRRYQPVRIEIDGELLPDPVGVIVAGNSRLYGGVVRITADARMDDGLLDLAILRARPGGRGWIDLATQATGALIDRARGRARAGYRRAAGFSLVAQGAMPLQVDGEFVTAVEAGHPVRLDIEPRALRILVPPAENPLFSFDDAPSDGTEGPTPPAG